MKADDQHLEVIIITGLSGAGRSEAANVLEDLGYFVIDNLPAPLISKVAELAGGKSAQRYAFVIDVRSGQFLDAIAGALEELTALGARTRILFLEASDESLVRRFDATRRRHPIDADRVSDGIATERAMLEDLRARADMIVDTSDYSVHDLAARLREMFAEPAASQMQVSVVSFGYKHGIPLDVDTMFDCRFLPNPHWVDALRPLTGQHPEVQAYVLERAETQDFLAELDRLLGLVLPAYVKEGKHYLSIGVGCTGGRHRSVVLAEEIAAISKRHGYPATVRHRDVERE
ncbi:MAG TPA: RNase adapter RapZ [Acidimicrobiia bacterium]|nr:RNase adapter RapZ [Acidimicrobiia bacterium]